MIKLSIIKKDMNQFAKILLFSFLVVSRVYAQEVPVVLGTYTNGNPGAISFTPVTNVAVLNATSQIWLPAGTNQMGNVNVTNWFHVHGNQTNDGSLSVAVNIIVGALTNTASFTLVQTNWIDGATYTNQTGRPIQVWAPCSINPSSVAGVAGYSLKVPGATTNDFSQVTLIGTLAMPSTNKVGPLWVANGGTFTFTNISSGVGDSAAIINGGQYMVY